MQKLRLPRKEGIHIARYRGVHWILVAKAPVVSVVDTDIDIRALVLFSGTANMNYLEVVEKVAVAAEGTAEAGVGDLYAADGESVGL